MARTTTAQKRANEKTAQTEMLRHEMRRILMTRFTDSGGLGMSVYDIMAKFNLPFYVDHAEALSMVTDRDRMMYDVGEAFSNGGLMDVKVKPSSYALALRIQCLEASLRDVKETAVRLLGGK